MKYRRRGRVKKKFSRKGPKRYPKYSSSRGGIRL